MSMEAVFLKLLNMSISATWLVLAVLILRLFLKKAPKAVHVFLWALVGIRLLLPVSVESMFSLIPSVQTIPPEITYAQTPEIHTGISILNQAVNPIIAQSFTPNPATSANPLQIWVAIGWNVWLLGAVCMLLYSAISYIRLRWQVRVNLQTEKNVFLCDRVDNPFILGIFRPRIYLPSGMHEDQQQYVLAHEYAHLKRKDHWWKPLGFLLLSLHWFNPILWVAYILLCRDIEFACDEKVIKDMDAHSKKGYSETLVACSMQRRFIMACPLAFGEVGVKARIKSVLHYKKPAFWIILICILLCVALSIGFLTDPISRTTIDPTLQRFLESQICDLNHGSHSQGDYYAADLEILHTKTKGNEITVYAWVLYSEYIYDGELRDVSGSHIPTVLTVKKDQSDYILLEYWTPRDGSYYPKDIRAKFPWYLHRKALDSQQYIKQQQARLDAKAMAYFQAQAVTSVFTYADSPDYISPTLSLNFKDNTFQFSYSAFSSYIPMGSFTLQNDRLIAKTDDGKYTYIFSRHPDGWAFAEDPSSPLPQYRYPDGLQTPVPDGALFTNAPLGPSPVTPPSLQIIGNTKTLTAWVGTYSLTTENADGHSQRTEADSPHPLTCLDNVPVLSLVPTTFSSKDPFAAVLEFSQTPASVSITRYPIHELTEGGATAVDYSENGLRLLYGTYLYEIIATFQSGASTGTVHYAFATGIPTLANGEIIFENEPKTLMEANLLEKNRLQLIFTKNKQDQRILGVGDQFTLEARYQDQWLPLETYMRSVLGKDYKEPEVMSDLLLHLLQPGIPFEMTHDLSSYDLPPGHYRICKEVTQTTDTGPILHPYYAEFTIPAA